MSRAASRPPGRLPGAGVAHFLSPFRRAPAPATGGGAGARRVYHGAVNQTPLPPHPLLGRQRDPRRFIGAAVSFLFHAAILLLIIHGTVDTFFQPPTGGSVLLPPGGGGGGGGGGGERVRYITLPPLQQAAAPAPVEQPAVPPPEVVPPDSRRADPRASRYPADSDGGRVVGGQRAGIRGGARRPRIGTRQWRREWWRFGRRCRNGYRGRERPREWRRRWRWVRSRATVVVRDACSSTSRRRNCEGETLRVTFHVRADGRVARIETDPDNRGSRLLAPLH